VKEFPRKLSAIWAYIFKSVQQAWLRPKKFQEGFKGALNYWPGRGAADLGALYGQQCIYGYCKLKTLSSRAVVSSVIERL